MDLLRMDTSVDTDEKTTTTPPSSPRFDSFNDGSCFIESVKTKSREPKTILKTMMVDFPENAITAILGPSGSGKTTLMSVITTSISMNVQANAILSLKGATAFIPQFDPLYGFFTCQTYLEHYARLAGIANDEDIKLRIASLLKQLGLTDQKDTVVGDVFKQGLSGGQKRRLSVALEALTLPTNLILDEPTSGLDAESAYQVMDFLKSYVRESPGRRVILTIHQPSHFLWKIIDHTILLSKGQLVYNGPRNRMEDFFSDSGHPTPLGWNPADYYVTIVNDEFRDHPHSVKQWAEKFETYKAKSRFELQRTPSMSEAKARRTTSTKRASAYGVSKELTYRYFINMLRNPGILGTRIAISAFLCSMIGPLYWKIGDQSDFLSLQSRTALSFYCVSVFIFMSVTVLPFSVMERDIIDKEVLNRYYHPVAYQISLAISSIPVAAILSFIITVMIISMTGMRDPVWYFIAMFASLVVAEAFSILVSHIVPHFVVGMALLGGVLGFFMLFQGYMIIPSEFPDWLGWMYHIAFHTYCWRTFMITEFGGDVTFEGTTLFQTGQDILRFYEIDDVERHHDMIILASYTIAIHLISVIILYFRYTVFSGKIEPPVRKAFTSQDELIVFFRIG